VTKIPLWNLAYIPKSIRRPCLLTRSRPHSYSKAIGLRNWVRDRSRTLNGASKITCESDKKIGSKNSLYHHKHFTEHLVDAFRKSPRKNNLNQEPSSLLIRRLENLTGFALQQFTLKWKIDTPLQTVCRTLSEHNAKLKRNLN
jgi:hypothetical protein